MVKVVHQKIWNRMSFEEKSFAGSVVGAGFDRRPLSWWRLPLRVVNVSNACSPDEQVSIAYARMCKGSPSPTFAFLTYVTGWRAGSACNGQTFTRSLNCWAT